MPATLARDQLGRLRAASPAMLRALAHLREAAASDASLIITGETGTGKELAAEAVHEASPRCHGPFVVVDCAAIAPELVESELFGHVRGAFTGADTNRVGAFEAANGGTVFIDELGELPLTLQPRLLRVLEKREVKPVGSNRLVPVDCRVVCATHRDLWAEVAAGRFREDLLYRLAVLQVELPPLRERPDDIRALTTHFASELNPFEPPLVEPATLQRLLAHTWPGNVRELRNTIERAAALSDRTLRLPPDFADDADLHLIETRPSAEEPPLEVGEGGHTRALWWGKDYKSAKAAVMEDFERNWLKALLEKHGHNVSSAAREAGIHRNLLHRMIARYGKLSEP